MKIFKTGTSSLQPEFSSSRKLYHCFNFIFPSFNPTFWHPVRPQKGGLAKTKIQWTIPQYILLLTSEPSCGAVAYITGHIFHPGFRFLFNHYVEKDPVSSNFLSQRNSPLRCGFIVSLKRYLLSKLWCNQSNYLAKHDQNCTQLLGVLLQ